MPESYSKDTTNSKDSLDPTTRHQCWQEVLDCSCESADLNTPQSCTPQQRAITSSSEQIRWSLVRTANVLSLILTVGPFVAGTIAFCITRNPWSFIALLPVFSQVSRIRRRPEESVFPISQEDLQIRLKELDIEAKRIEKQSKAASHPLFSWLHRLSSKSSE